MRYKNTPYCYKISKKTKKHRFENVKQIPLKKQEKFHIFEFCDII